MPEPLPAAAAHSPRALYVLLLVVFINLVGFGLVIPLLPFYAQSLKAEPWQITALFSAYSLGQFFAEPFWGRLSDRIGRRPVLIVTILANTLSYIALAFAPNILAAFAIRLIGGFATGNISTIQGYMADVTPPEKRAGRMGLLGSAFGAGFVVGPALGGLLAHPEAGQIGFQIPLFAAAGMAALAALGVFLFVVESRAPSAPDAPRPHRREALQAARSHPVLSRVLLVTLVSTAAFAGMESIFGLWTHARFDWGPRQVGLCFAVIGDHCPEPGDDAFCVQRRGRTALRRPDRHGALPGLPLCRGPDLARHPAGSAGRNAGPQHGGRLAGPHGRPPAGGSAVWPQHRWPLLVRGPADPAGDLAGGQSGEAGQDGGLNASTLDNPNERR